MYGDSVCIFEEIVYVYVVCVCYEEIVYVCLFEEIVYVYLRR